MAEVGRGLGLTISLGMSVSCPRAGVFFSRSVVARLCKANGARFVEKIKIRPV